MDIHETRSVEQLINLYRKGKHPKYLFFWGHTNKNPETVNQSCFSNWFPASFELDGVRYPTTEHYMMAEKALLFGDKETRLQIVNSGSPVKAKALGRQVSGFTEEIWKQNRFNIVVKGNEAKFRQNTELGHFLINTGNKVIVEASPEDRIWGIGMGQSNEKAENPIEWKGLNLLGFALMEVRSRLLQNG